MGTFMVLLELKMPLVPAGMCRFKSLLHWPRTTRCHALQGRHNSMLPAASRICAKGSAKEPFGYALMFPATAELLSLVVKYLYDALDSPIYPEHMSTRTWNSIRDVCLPTPHETCVVYACLKVRMCKGSGCRKSAGFNFPRVGLKADYCEEHRAQGMVSLRARGCKVRLR